MRNNRDRIGVDLEPEKESFPEPSLITGLNYITPTDFVLLPSKGKHYGQNHPLHGVETVEIKYMTAKEEDILASRSLIKQGIAIDRLIESVLIDKRIKSKDLLPGDKNAILIATRISGFGSDYRTKVPCASCSHTNMLDFDLSLIGPKEEADYEELGVTETENGTFIIELPRTKANVEVRLLTAKDETELTEIFDRREKKNLPISAATTQLSYIIVSINNNTDRSLINSFIENIPAYDSRHLRNVYQKLVPNVDLMLNFNCEKCDFEQEVMLPMTVDFFWSRR